MRRIIPILCAMLMVIIIIQVYDKDAETDITPNETTEIVAIPTPTPTPTPTITPEPVPIIPEPTPAPMMTPDPTPEPVWWTEYDLDLLAAVIFYEAGSDCCTDERQQLVGQVVINRMNDSRFPDTIYGVITDTKYCVQYSTADDVVANAGNHNIIPQRCYDNALVILNGEIDCPTDVIFQANFKQGTGVYKTFKTPYSTTYFCHG